jgi:hypothetical protein
MLDDIMVRDQVIRSLYPNVVSIAESDDGVEAFDENGDLVERDDEFVQAEVDSMQAAYDALQYQRDREPEYPSMADQLDYIYHNGIAKWKSDMIKPVKDAHPKP